MKLLHHSNGMVIAFGFDVLNRRRDDHIICWSDFDGTSWESKITNSAGFWRAPFCIEPQFVNETRVSVVAYQPGLCIEMALTGAPFVWAFDFLRPESPQLSQAA